MFVPHFIKVFLFVLFRHKSGHSFHSSYMMSLINGAAVFVYILWWSKSNFWIT